LTTIKEKLKKLKYDLKSWNKEVFGLIGTKKQKLIMEIGDLDKKDDESSLEDVEKLRRMNLLCELKMLLQKESSMMNQNARIKWMQQGDINLKYFHSKIRWSKIKNELKGVDVNGMWCEDPNKIREEVRSAFEIRFTTPNNIHLSLHHIEFPTISEDDNRSLIMEIKEHEIVEAINQCGSNKSPSLDGFNFCFIKQNWATLKNDVCQAIKWFHSTSRIPKGCNASFIALVPKKQIPLGVDDYRLISLVGCVYKIISKILANRLKRYYLRSLTTLNLRFLKEEVLWIVY